MKRSTRIRRLGTIEQLKKMHRDRAAASFSVVEYERLQATEARDEAEVELERGLDRAAEQLAQMRNGADFWLCQMQQEAARADLEASASRLLGVEREWDQARQFLGEREIELRRIEKLLARARQELAQQHDTQQQRELDDSAPTRARRSV